jgi:enoyl-CoA hydratase/carnithine racemase
MLSKSALARLPMSVLRVHVHQAAGTIILNRPEKRNALSRELLAALDQALDDLLQERRVRAVVLTGGGTAFCAGMDLAEMQATSQQPDARQQWQADTEQYRDLLETMLRYPKPLVAAVNGPCLAGGAGLMLACDVVLASDSATFGLPEPLRGITAGVVSPLLAFRIGAGHAGRLLLTAATIDAEEARRIGLFHEVLHPDKLWARAVELAGEMARASPDALTLTKRMLNETIGEPLAAQLSAGAALSAAARTTEAAAEGLQAFLEKRPPKWP